MKDQRLYHRGYTVRFKRDGLIWYGKIENIKDLITAEESSFWNLLPAAIAMIDDYIETCEELGVKANTPGISPLPCPFCGSSDIKAYMGRVHCNGCAATIELQNTNTHGAIERWNRRSGSEATPATDSACVWRYKGTLWELQERFGLL